MSFSHILVSIPYSRGTNKPQSTVGAGMGSPLASPAKLQKALLSKGKAPLRAPLCMPSIVGPDFKEERFLWLTVSEVLVHDYLALLFLDHGQAQHSGEGDQDKAAFPAQPGLGGTGIGHIFQGYTPP